MQQLFVWKPSREILHQGDMAICMVTVDGAFTPGKCSFNTFEVSRNMQKHQHLTTKSPHESHAFKTHTAHYCHIRVLVILIIKRSN